MTADLKLMKLYLAGVACLCGLGNAWSGDFARAYDAALSNDATYQAARAELASVQQAVPIARAGLLPSVSFSMSDSKVNGTRTVDDTLGNAVTSPLDYRTPSQSLNIRAPLYNREASKKFTMAQTQANYGQVVFATRKLELLDRLATTYLQRLQAGQALVAARARLIAAQSQSDLTRRQLQLGEGTRPEVMDADAAVETARVLVMEAQSQIEVATLNLRQITGAQVSGLSDSLQRLEADNPQWPQPAAAPADQLARLLDQALASNPTIAARRYAVEMAQATVAINGAGHYPRLDFVASASNSRNESLSTLNQSAEQRSWGLQLNVPIYSGGAVSASVKQALADQDKAQAELAAEQRSVALDLTRLFHVVVNGGPKIQARQKTVAANQLALEGAQKAFATGFNTQADVVQAQNKLAQSRNDLAQADYEYLLARVRLSARAGAEPDQVVVELDGLLN